MECVGLLIRIIEDAAHIDVFDKDKSEKTF